jgi:hypothetical protein
MAVKPEHASILANCRPLDRGTDLPNIVLATSPKYSRRKKPAKAPQNGPAIVQARLATRQTSALLGTRCALHRPGPEPGSKPYLSLNIPKAPPDPEADRKAKAFFNRMMPNHPMLQDDD